jgi:aminoglycoside phosphotransferase (APT) family kinase protein
MAQVSMPGRDRVADVHSVLATQLPDYRVDTVAHVGAGLDNEAYEVNGELIVRFSREPNRTRRAALVNREARLLAAVAEISPLPVPEPTFTAAEQGCLAYAKLPGTTLIDVAWPPQLEHITSVAADVGALLTALHAAPVARWRELVGTDEGPLAEWLRDAALTYPSIAAQVPAAHRRPVETFLAAAVPQELHAPAFSHNDLGIEHILVDAGTWKVTGVIDWSDAAIVDPAYDFGLLYRDLGPAALRTAIESYRSDDNDLAALEERAIFYARCSVLEDLAYAVETGKDRYLGKSLAALEWLFPA